MTAATAHRTAQAAEIRVGDVLLAGEVVETRRRPMRGVGGAVELVFVDGATDHVRDGATVIVLAWGPRTLSW